MKLNGVLIKTFVHSNGHKCNVYVPAIDYYDKEHEMPERFFRDILSIFETQPELREPIQSSQISQPSQISPEKMQKIAGG